MEQPKPIEYKLYSFEFKKIKCKKKECPRMIKPISVKVTAEVSSKLFERQEEYDIFVFYKVANSTANLIFPLLKMPTKNIVARRLIGRLMSVTPHLLYCEEHQVLETIKR